MGGGGGYCAQQGTLRENASLFLNVLINILFLKYKNILFRKCKYSVMDVFNETLQLVHSSLVSVGVIMDVEYTWIF